MMTKDSLVLKTTISALACLLLSGCFGPRDSLVREPVVPDQLYRVEDRISDEAILSDHQVIEGLRSRLRKLNQKGGQWTMDNYYVCKAQAWIDFAETEYTDNDRGNVIENALGEARKLIIQMEADVQNISRDTLIIPESMVVRKDLWDFVSKRKAEGGPQCTECDLAKLEVQLVATGHDHSELGWRHAASGVLASERLARAVKYGREGCAASAGAAPVMVSAVAVVGDGGQSVVGPAVSALGMISPDELRVPVVVHFAYNKSMLSEETTTVLSRAIEIMKAYPDITVMLVGHTDPRGSSKYNDALSKRRAVSVRNYLVKQGITPRRISDEGRGKEQPLNADAPLLKALALDRRVELHFDNLPPLVTKTERQQTDVQADH